jgi:hypothetical protein
MATHDPYQPPDEVNPYAAPETELSPRLPGPMAPAVGEIEPFSVDAVIKRAWRIFKERLGICLAIVLGVIGLQFGYQLAGQFLTGILAGANADASLIVLANIAFLLSLYALQFWLTIGQTIALIKLARDQDVSFEEVFRGGRFFWRYVGAILLFLLIFILIFLACAIPAVIGAVATMGVEDTAVKVIAIGAGALVGIVAFIMISLRFYQFPYVLVDQDCGPVDSLRISYEITRGHVGELFAISILAGLIAFSGALACLVGMIFTIPLSMLIAATTYVCLVGGRSGVTKPPPRTDLEFIDFQP